MKATTGLAWRADALLVGVEVGVSIDDGVVAGGNELPKVS